MQKDIVCSLILEWHPAILRGYAGPLCYPEKSSTFLGTRVSLPYGMGLRLGPSKPLTYYVLPHPTEIGSKSPGLYRPPFTGEKHCFPEFPYDKLSFFLIDQIYITGLSCGSINLGGGR